MSQLIQNLPAVSAASLRLPDREKLRTSVSTHKPRILMLYGSLRERSYSRFLTFEAARLLEHFGAEVRIYEAAGLPLPDDTTADALVFAILAVSATRPQAVAAAVALVIAAGYWWTASTSFANPAITIARSLTDTFAGVRPADAPGFIAAQISGALAASFVCAILFPRRAAP